MTCFAIAALIATAGSAQAGASVETDCSIELGAYVAEDFIAIEVGRDVEIVAGVYARPAVALQRLERPRPEEILVETNGAGDRTPLIYSLTRVPFAPPATRRFRIEPRFYVGREVLAIGNAGLALELEPFSQSASVRLRFEL